MHVVSRVQKIALILTFLPLALLAQSQTHPGKGAGSYNPVLQIGPIPGLTTVWHPAPTETAVPAGVNLQFKVRLLTGGARWTGARVIDTQRHSSTAELELEKPGDYVVTVEYTNPQGEKTEDRAILNALDTTAFPISFSNPRLWAEPVVIDETSANEDSMRYYFGSSIAGVTRVSERRYRTSSNRWFHLEVEVEPREFAPLVEWRLNGIVQKHLGESINMQVFPPREHTINVGLVDDAEEFDISLEIYMVRISSHVRSDVIPEFMPVTFRAETIPPGHEQEITWLASTKYGACAPQFGQGPEFTVRFFNTLGEEGAWLGVRADNAVFGKDNKRSRNIVRSDDFIGGAASKISIGTADLGAWVVGSRNASGNLRITSWFTTEFGMIVPGQDEIAGAATEVAVSNLYNVFPTSVIRNGDGDLEITSWDSTFNSLEPMATVVSDQANRVAVAETLFGRIVTATIGPGGGIDLVVWRRSGRLLERVDGVSIGGTFDEVSISSFTSPPEVSTVVIAARNDVGAMEVMAFELVESEHVVPRGDVVAEGEASNISVSAFPFLSLNERSRFGTAFRDAEGKLRLLVWEVAEHEIRRVGAASAGLVDRTSISTCCENKMIVAARDGDGELKVSLWEIAGSGTPLLLGEAGAGLISEVSVASRENEKGNPRFVTAVRDSGDNLKIILWDYEP